MASGAAKVAGAGATCPAGTEQTGAATNSAVNTTSGCGPTGAAATNQPATVATGPTGCHPGTTVAAIADQAGIAAGTTGRRR